MPVCENTNHLTEGRGGQLPCSPAFPRPRPSRQGTPRSSGCSITWVSSGGTYKGYIDNTEAMFASGLSDTGLSYPEAGLESMSCRTQMWSNTYDSLTTQSWSTLQWSYWTSGQRDTPSPPARSVWIQTPTSSGSVNPSFQVAEAP